jgi:hypothetical protein
LPQAGSVYCLAEPLVELPAGPLNSADPLFPQAAQGWWSAATAPYSEQAFAEGRNQGSA